MGKIVNLILLWVLIFGVSSDLASVEANVGSKKRCHTKPNFLHPRREAGGIELSLSPMRGRGDRGRELINTGHASLIFLAFPRGCFELIYLSLCKLKQNCWVGEVPNPLGKVAEEMNPKKEAIDLLERLRKLGNLVALTFIVIAQFVAQGGVLFFTIWVSVFLGGRNLVEDWAYRVARVKEVL